MESAPLLSRPARVIAAACGFFTFTKKDAWVLLPIAADTALIAILWAHRTDAAIASPWNALPWGIFPLYALATATLFLIFPLLGNTAKRIAFILHAFATYGVSVIVYALGFGYDPFIHQAAEAHLATHGSIGSQNILYLGQYALVAGLSHLTGIPTRVIDIVLVPLLASLIVPLTLLKRFPGRRSLMIFLVLTPFFTFTIPYHLAILCLFLLLFLGQWLKESRASWAIALLALAALATHPLAGIPACAIAMTYLLPQRLNATWRAAVAGILTAGGLIGAFAMQTLLAGGTILPPSIETARTAAAVLFGNPYASAPNSWLKAFYAALRLLPLAWIALGLWGYAQKSGWKRIFTHLPVAMAAGITLAALFLAGHIRLPDILPNEQYEFALRLTALLPLFFLEGVVHTAQRISRSQRVWTRLAALAGIGLLATCQWFLSYPQSNAVASFSARGMGREEITAVHAIEADAAGEPYAVLAHPLMSVAALQAFGFERTRTTPWGERYFYPIPTGNELYRLYLDLFIHENPSTLLPVIANTFHGGRFYIAIPTEWDPDKRLYDQLTPWAARTWTIEPRITIYAFE